MLEERVFKFERQEAESTDPQPLTVPGFEMFELSEQFSSRPPERYEEITLPDGSSSRAWFEATEEWIVHVTSNKDSRYVGTLKYRLGQGKVTNVPGIRAEDTHDLFPA